MVRHGAIFDISANPVGGHTKCASPNLIGLPEILGANAFAARLTCGFRAIPARMSDLRSPRDQPHDSIAIPRYGPLGLISRAHQGLQAADSAGKSRLSKQTKQNQQHIEQFSRQAT